MTLTILQNKLSARSRPHLASFLGFRLATFGNVMKNNMMKDNFSCHVLVHLFWASTGFFIHLRLMKRRCGCYDDPNFKNQIYFRETVVLENGACRNDCLKIGFGLSGPEKEKGRPTRPILPPWRLVCPGCPSFFLVLPAASFITKPCVVNLP